MILLFKCYAKMYYLKILTKIFFHTTKKLIKAGQPEEGIRILLDASMNPGVKKINLNTSLKFE